MRAHGVHASRSLDALGNWNSVTDETSTTQTRTHDDQNRLIGVSGANSPTFSSNGVAVVGGGELPDQVFPGAPVPPSLTAHDIG